MFRMFRLALIMVIGRATVALFGYQEPEGSSISKATFNYGKRPLLLKKRILLGILVICFTVMVIPHAVCAKERMVDAVYLKDGRVFRGEIIELDLDRHVKLRSDDGEIYVFVVEEVRKIAEEMISDDPIRSEREIKLSRRKRIKRTGIAVTAVGGSLVTTGGLTWSSPRVDVALPAFFIVSGVIITAIGLSVLATLQDEPAPTASIDWGIGVGEEIGLVYRF